MRQISRRDFVEQSLVGGLAIAGAGATPAAAFGARARSRLADAHIELLLDEPTGTIAPEIYGHFVEELGGVVYDGIWVGENSKIPNYNGVRKALVDAFRAVRPSVVRWPGGCAADDYDWRDGIGPRAKRPRRTNFWANDPNLKKLGATPQSYDPNEFGTQEFLRFCKLVQAQPYLAVNLRQLPPRQFVEWVEFCNSPAGSTSLAELRGSYGDREPFGVRFWGVGNEAWGCGGDFTPEAYASEFRRFTAGGVHDFGVKLAFIGSGPNGGDLEWTRRFFASMAERNALGRMWGWALHHYSNAPDREALAFNTTNWYECLRSANQMESLITSHWQVMGQFDRDHRVKFAVDEWGAWYRQNTNVDPTHLFGQQSTIRDALVAGLTLDTFNRHADKVAMANVAQLVNCIQSLFLAHEDRFLLTPTYHVFAMYAAHQGAQGVRALFAAPHVAWTDAQQRPRELWGLNGSASLNGRVLTLTVTNSHATDARDTEVALRGGSARSVKVTTLSAADIHAHNTFESPATVTPVETEISASGATLVHRFPAASVTKLRIELS